MQHTGAANDPNRPLCLVTQALLGKVKMLASESHDSTESMGDLCVYTTTA